jgi:hypothetical protein
VSDPVAWLMIEEGWAVLGRDGLELGRVKEVLGDENADIFDGLRVSAGVMRKDGYVPAERVAAIYEGRIELDLDQSGLDALDETGPGSVRAAAD